MTAGDITIIGPIDVNDTAAIDTALTGAVIVADVFTSWSESGQVWFAIVKAA